MGIGVAQGFLWSQEVALPPDGVMAMNKPLYDETAELSTHTHRHTCVHVLMGGGYADWCVTKSSDHAHMCAHMSSLVIIQVCVRDKT